MPAWAHSARIEVKGLEPNRPYWYQFLAGNEVSPVGRTRTAPAPKDVPARLRLAYASGQHYEQGYFNAYRHMVADDPDLIVFLGDYIHSSSASTDAVRKHTPTRSPYRSRLPGASALYKEDADLRAAHAAVPWILTWNDHEVQPGYAGDQPDSNISPELFPRASRCRLQGLLRASAAARSHAARTVRRCGCTCRWGGDRWRGFRARRAAVPRSRGLSPRRQARRR